MLCVVLGFMRWIGWKGGGGALYGAQSLLIGDRTRELSSGWSGKAKLAGAKEQGLARSDTMTDIAKCAGTVSSLRQRSSVPRLSSSQLSRASATIFFRKCAKRQI